MRAIPLILAVICILSTAMQLIAAKHWWVRIFDFPHLQLTIVTFIAFLTLLFSIDYSKIIELLIIILLGISLIYQIIIIYPYTPIAKKQIVSTNTKNSDASIRVFSANVLQDNRDFDAFSKVFEKANPDIAVLLETNAWWQNKIQPYKVDYPYTVEYPLENLYGIILLSKFKLKDAEVKFLIDDEIPSIHGSVQLKNGTWVKLHCLHPMPPAPNENEKSLDRDAEILLVAKEVKEENFPLMVLGDLNDVAWSHTTRTFQRISQLLDPRIGRGFYNTFHVDYFLFRWPLDHLFVSEDFKLAELKRLETIGSDHFPIFAELCHVYHAEENTKPDDASKEDEKEAEETIEQGLEENSGR